MPGSEEDLLILSSPKSDSSKRKDGGGPAAPAAAVKSPPPKVEEEERDEFGLLMPKRKTAPPPDKDSGSVKGGPLLQKGKTPSVVGVQNSSNLRSASSGTPTGTPTGTGLGINAGGNQNLYKQEFSTSSSKSNGIKMEGFGGGSKRSSVIVPEGKSSVEIPSPPPKPQVSEWSHLALVTKKEENVNKNQDDLLDDGEWQEMPAYASQDLYDDDGRLIATEQVESDIEGADELRGGARKGYTRVGDDEDTQSVTSMDENTSYLFDGKGMDDEASKTPLSQMQATKEFLTEGQRVAYVGVCRLAMAEMIKEQEKLNGGKGKNIRKALGTAVEHTRMWAQRMIHRIYTHMDISTEGKL